MSAGCRNATSASGTNGPTRTATSARSTASSGATGKRADGRHIDQIADLVDLIQRDPSSRRQIVTAWNPGEIDRMALAPCHCLFQTQVAGGRLNLQLYQRSADLFLGVPFNIASYALLTHMLARECGLEPGVFVWTGGDVHLYSNHLDQARLQLAREPRPLPQLILKDRGQGLFDYEPEDFAFEAYDPHPHISAPVAVWAIARRIIRKLRSANEPLARALRSAVRQ